MSAYTACLIITSYCYTFVVASDYFAAFAIVADCV